MADVAEKIRFDAAIRKEFAIHAVIVETGHWSAVETERACSDNEITALQRAIAECRPLRNGRIGKPNLGLWILRIKKRNVPGEIEIVADDRGRRCCHGL